MVAPSANRSGHVSPTTAQHVLADLRGRLQGNDKLDEILLATLTDDVKRAQLKAELESAGGEDG